MNPFLLVWIVLLVGLFWMLILRPQRNARRRSAELVESLEVGDEVITVGGLYGHIVSIGDGEVELEVAEDVILRFARRAIAGKAPDEPDEVEDDEYDDDEIEDAELEDDDDIHDELEDVDAPEHVAVIEAAPNAEESTGR
jgi:preprotein translocase subunit YajC